MKTCTYTIGNLEYSYDSLLEAISGNTNLLTLDINKIKDVILSDTTPQDETSAKLGLLKQNNANLTLDEKVNADGTLTLTAPNGYMTTQNLMKNESFGSLFDLNEFKTQKFEEIKNNLIASGVSEESARTQALNEISKMVEDFSRVSLEARNIKYASALFWGNPQILAPEMMNLMKKNGMDIPNGWDEKTYTHLINKFKNITKQITNDYKGAKIVGNLNLTSNIRDPYKEKLLDKLDIVAIDTSGIAHVYTVRISENLPWNFSQAQLDELDYKLAFDRQLLAANGFVMNNNDLSVINLTINNKNEDRFSFTIDSRVQRAKENRLIWGLGSFYTKVKDCIPASVTDAPVSREFDNTISDAMSKMFGLNPETGEVTETQIINFISKNVVESTDKSKGDWMFVGRTDDDKQQNIYSFGKYKIPNDDLKAKVTSFLTKRNNDYSKVIGFITSKIALSMKSENPVTRMDGFINAFRSAELSKVKSWMYKYTDPVWEVYNLPQLTNQNIIAFLNTDTHQVDLIDICHDDLFTEHGFHLGTTLLGKWMTDREALQDKNTLKSLTGNIQLMKVMNIINNLPAIFQNKDVKVGNIRIVNPYLNQSTQAARIELFSNFNRLIQKTGLKNNLSDVVFSDEYTMLTQDFEALYNDFSDDTALADAASGFMSARTRIEKLEAVNNLIHNIEAYDKYKKLINDSLANNTPLISNRKDDRIMRLYLNAYMTKLWLEGDPFYQSNAMKKWNMSTGTQVTPMSTIGDKNLRTVGTWISETFDVLTQKFNAWRDDFQTKYVVNGIWKEKGYSFGQENAIGNQNDLYANLFAVDDTGKILPSLIFKNPWTDTSLTDGEKVFLKKVLLECNKARKIELLKGINDPEDPKLQWAVESINENRGFWVPLIPATGAERFSETGVKGWCKRIKQNLSNGRDYFQRVYENQSTDTPDMQAKARSIEKGEAAEFETWDPLGMSEHDYASRQTYIMSKPLDYWSKNVEHVTNAMVFNSMKKESYDRVLPAIRAMKLILKVYGTTTGVDVENTIDWLDKQVKIAIHSRTILNDEMKNIAGYVAQAKYLTSALMLGFNPRGLCREYFEGLFKHAIKAYAPLYSKKFKYEDIMFAYKVFFEDLVHQTDNFTIGERLNQMFRLVGLDINRLADKTITGQGGVYNFQDRWMYFCNTHPDYMKRLVMLVAQLHHDGIWDALSVKDGKLVYDWKKDKRFDILAKGDKTNPEYGKQKGLYLTLVNDSNENYGTNLKFGDDLTRMYTQKEIISLKDYSDRVFGYYDHETKMQGEKTFFGMLFLQFQTYLSATKTTWLTAKGTYNMGAMEQATDEKTGQKIWMKDEVAGDGTITTVPTLENTGVPLLVPVDSYYEGIVFTLQEAYKAFMRGGFNAYKNEIWNDSIRNANIQHFLRSLLATILMMVLARMLMSFRKEIAAATVGQVPKLTSAMINGSADFLQKAMSGSVGDLDIFGTIYTSINDTEPASVSMITNLLRSTRGLIFGGRSFDSYLKTNVGAYRSLSGFTEEIFK